MKVYALYHPATGQYMPEMKKGYSWWDPVKYPMDKQFPIPRIFQSELHAMRAKIAWEAGPWSRVTIKYIGDYGMDSEDHHPKPVKTKDVTERSSGDLKIVAMTLTERNMS